MNNSLLPCLSGLLPQAKNAADVDSVVISPRKASSLGLFLPDLKLPGVLVAQATKSCKIVWTSFLRGWQAWFHLR